ncbi:hypothetical protein C7D74_31335, partial [Klebsiella pneumoniae]
IFSKKKLSEYIKVTGFDSREILILINIKSISKKLPSRIINRISCLFNELYIYSDFITIVINKIFYTKCYMILIEIIIA